MTCRLNLGDVYLDGMFVLFFDITSCSVASPLRLRISRESLLVPPTASILYALLGGIGADLAGGGVYQNQQQQNRFPVIFTIQVFLDIILSRQHIVFRKDLHS